MGRYLALVAADCHLPLRLTDGYDLPRACSPPVIDLSHGLATIGLYRQNSTRQEENDE